MYCKCMYLVLLASVALVTFMQIVVCAISCCHLFTGFLIDILHLCSFIVWCYQSMQCEATCWISEENFYCHLELAQLFFLFTLLLLLFCNVSLTYIDWSLIWQWCGVGCSRSICWRHLCFVWHWVCKWRHFRISRQYELVNGVCHIDIFCTRVCVFGFFGLFNHFSPPIFSVFVVPESIVLTCLEEVDVCSTEILKWCI